MVVFAGFVEDIRLVDVCEVIEGGKVLIALVLERWVCRLYSPG
jgi:hypothetical protein